MTTTTTDRAALAALAQRALDAVGSGTLDDLRGLVHPDAVNHESVSEPPAARGDGPEAFWATALWLREAFSDMVFETTTVVVEGDLVVTHGTMAGRQTGPFVVWTPQARVERVFVPTGRSFRVHHAHFQRVRDGQVVEHWAVRDDQALAQQLGWVPPSPAYLLRCALATRRAQRAG